MATTRKADEKAKLLQKLSKSLGASEDEVVLRALRELHARMALPAPEEPAPAKAAAARTAAAEKTAAAAKADAAEKSAAGKAAAAKAAPRKTAFPQRLYLLLDGRGLDGRGMPIEVIDLPATLGTSRKSTIWVNSPHIETRHLQITHDDDGWLLEDLGTERGTFLGDERITRRIIQHGDEYSLAGYLRMRTELR